MVQAGRHYREGDGEEEWWESEGKLHERAMELSTGVATHPSRQKRLSVAKSQVSTTVQGIS